MSQLKTHFNLQNKVVVITGAGSGIGAASALLFAAHGAKVVVSDLNIEKANNTVSAIQKDGGTAIAQQTNVAKEDEMQLLINQTVDQFGQLDVIVNNAGIGPKKMKRTGEYEMSDWDNVVLVNQTGVFYGMKYAIQKMLQQPTGGAIVNIASLAGIKASTHNISYAASKAAVIGMTKAAALEYATKNIRVNSVCPGYTQSALLEKLLATRDDMEAALKSATPMRRFGEANEIAQAVAWLASDLSSYMTGQAVVLDGGMGL